MEKELVEIIRFKRFIELSPGEKEVIKEWCNSEEEFDQLQDVLNATDILSMSEKVVPKKETKVSLDQLFSQKQNEKKPVFWYNSILMVMFPTEKKWIYRPVFQFAAVCLLVVLIYPFLASKEIIQETRQVASSNNGTSLKQTKIPASTNDKKIDLNISTSIEKQQAAKNKNPHVSARQSFPTTKYADLIGVSQIREEGVVVVCPQNDFETVTTGPQYLAVSRKMNQIDDMDMKVEQTNMSQSAAKQPGLFDLLTATF